MLYNSIRLCNFVNANQKFKMPRLGRRVPSFAHFLDLLYICIMQDRIRLIMEQAGLTQQQFADRINVSPASLSSIFTGRTNPTNKHVQAIHLAFPEININWLMFGEGEMRLSSPALATVMSGDRVPLPSEGDAAAVSSPVDLFSSVEPVAMPPVSMPTFSETERRTTPHDAARREEAETRPVSKESFLHDGVMRASRSERKIQEIRVFFSDGTYESFAPPKK